MKDGKGVCQPRFSLSMQARVESKINKLWLKRRKDLLWHSKLDFGFISLSAQMLEAYENAFLWPGPLADCSHAVRTPY